MFAGGSGSQAPDRVEAAFNGQPIGVQFEDTFADIFWVMSANAQEVAAKISRSH